MRDDNDDREKGVEYTAADDERSGLDQDEIRQSLDDAVRDRDVRTGGVLLVGVGILLIIVVSFAVPAGLVIYLSSQEQAVQQEQARTLPPRATVPVPPAPNLQVNEYGDWDFIRRQQLGELQQYGFTNERAGRARIPIGRAMDILVRKGQQALPVREGYERYPIDREGFAEAEAAEWTSGRSVQSGR